jgi:hypothetical protein
VARKINLKAPVELAPYISESVKREREFGKQFDPDSMEGRIFQQYIDAMIRYEEAQARLAVLADKPEKKAAFTKQLAEVDRTMRTMFQTFDAFQASLRNTITVAESEVRQIILDALSANPDAIPGLEDQTGLERHREFKRLADQVFEDLKTNAVKIHEDTTQEAPYCAACEAELAA